MRHLRASLSSALAKAAGAHPTSAAMTSPDRSRIASSWLIPDLCGALASELPACVAPSQHWPPISDVGLHVGLETARQDRGRIRRGEGPRGFTLHPQPIVHQTLSNPKFYI